MGLSPPEVARLLKEAQRLARRLAKASRLKDAVAREVLAEQTSLAIVRHRVLVARDLAGAVPSEVARTLASGPSNIKRLLDALELTKAGESEAEGFV